MTRRTRLPAALLALFALLTFPVEGAATPPCTVESTTEVAADGPSDDHGRHAPASDDRAPIPADAPCPMGMTSGGTCIAPSAPTESPTSAAEPLDSTPVPAAPDDTRDRLLIAPHFRPPQA
jgi:hypothetical protein